MKLIIKIAKNELRNLFYSPVAWFLAIVFLVMCAFFYTGILYPAAKLADVIFRVDPNWIYKTWDSETARNFFGFFFSLLQHIYLFVPLLTMSVISREINNGTIKLLYSSPVKLRQIVLGKYLALMIYNLILVSIIGFFIISGFFDIKSLDFGPLLSGVLGFYLMLCALTAIGFFMSSLTTYPIVSAIASFTLLFALMNISGLWQEYDFARDITYSLSIAGRTETMLVGLITTRDVIYFLVIIFMFVGFTLLKLSAGREVKPWYIKTARYMAIIISGLLIGYISSRPAYISYFDTTVRKINTLREPTQQILKELGDSTLEVTLYTNLFDDHSDNVEIGLPRSRNVYLGMWEQYVRFKPDIQFKYEYYYDYDAVEKDSALYKKFPGKTMQQIAGLLAKGYQVDSAMFKSPEEMRKLVDLKPEGFTSVMQLKYRGRTTFLRSLPSALSETEPVLNQVNFNAAFKRLLGTKMPKVAFVSGELERSIYKKGEREYWSHTIAKRAPESLINIGFDVDTINLAAQDIPSDVTTLVLADPKMELSTVVMRKLKNYLNNGGNMLVLGEPGKQYVTNPLLQQLGVQLLNGELVQPTPNDMPDKIWSYFTPTLFNISNEYVLRYNNYLFSNNSYFEGFSKVIITGMTGLSSTQDSGFTIKPLVITKPLNHAARMELWLKAGRLVVDSAAPVFNAQEGDIKKDSFATALQLTRQINGKEQRIIVGGDADLMSISAFYSWLNDNKFPIYTPVPPAKDNKVVLRPGWAKGQKIVYVWVLPGLLLIFGTLLLIRRKRK